MKFYEFCFHGRRKAAIGITYGIKAVVQANTEKEARLKLYESYENIHYPQITKIWEEPDDL